MSMGESEEPFDLNNLLLPSSLPRQGPVIPADFSEDDLLFAQELDSLFSIEDEEVPPYFVQTLLESEDSRFTPVERGFEQKTHARVFRRLKIRRRIYPKARTSFQAFTGRRGQGRRALMFTTSLLAFMLVTMAFAMPSFASGMELLLQGTQFGVHLVQGSLPNKAITSATSKPANADDQPRQLDPIGVEAALHFHHIYWPQYIPSTYTLSGMYLYTQNAFQFAIDGPMLELQYTYNQATSPSGESGHLAIREFIPQGDVQVAAETGATQVLQQDAAGRPTEIYIDGSWVTYNHSHRWVSGSHFELMIQRDNVVFWIAGDRSNGLDVNDLSMIADSLRPMQVYLLLHTGESQDYFTQFSKTQRGPFDGDIITFPPKNGSSDRPYFILGSNSQPTTNSPPKHK